MILNFISSHLPPLSVADLSSIFSFIRDLWDWIYAFLVNTRFYKYAEITPKELMRKDPQILHQEQNTTQQLAKQMEHEDDAHIHK